MSMTQKPRMIWFDANRVCAAIGVTIIHSTCDTSGRVFADAAPSERIIPVLLRSIGEISGSEMFFTFSLFLLAMKLDRKRVGYAANLADQMRRLLVPFAVWTVFYAFFRLIKADAFHYDAQIWAQLGDWHNWLAYFVLGSAQYHLHFLPTLFLLMFFVPVMKLGQRFPLFGLAIVLCLGAMQTAQGAIWSLPIDGLPRDYLLRATKVLGYVGYGLAAFSLYGLWKDGIARGESRLIRQAGFFFVAIALLACLPFYAAAAKNGVYAAREGWAFYGHFLMPMAVFAIFLGSQHLNWNPRWSRLSQYTFGVYLLHPAVIDLIDVAVKSAGLTPAPWAIVTIKGLVVAPLTLALVIAISRSTLLAWTVGLGELPWKAARPAAPQLQMQG